MARRVHELTERERDVLRLLKQGHSQVKIAALLQVEVATIYQYTWIMRQKCQADTTLQMILKPLDGYTTSLTEGRA